MHACVVCVCCLCMYICVYMHRKKCAVLPPQKRTFRSPVSRRPSRPSLRIRSSVTHMLCAQLSGSHDDDDDADGEYVVCVRKTRNHLLLLLVVVVLLLVYRWNQQRGPYVFPTSSPVEKTKMLEISDRRTGSIMK